MHIYFWPKLSNSTLEYVSQNRQRINPPPPPWPTNKSLERWQGFFKVTCPLVIRISRNSLRRCKKKSAWSVLVSSKVLSDILLKHSKEDTEIPTVGSWPLLMIMQTDKLTVFQKNYTEHWFLIKTMVHRSWT